MAASSIPTCFISQLLYDAPELIIVMQQNIFISTSVSKTTISFVFPFTLASFPGSHAHKSLGMRLHLPVPLWILSAEALCARHPCQNGQPIEKVMSHSKNESQVT